MIGQYCDAYGCTALVARWEMENDPEGLGLRIMGLRAYAQAKTTLDATTDKTSLKMTPMMQTVFAIQNELLAPRQAPPEAT